MVRVMYGAVEADYGATGERRGSRPHPTPQDKYATRELKAEGVHDGVRMGGAANRRKAVAGGAVSPPTTQGNTRGGRPRHATARGFTTVAAAGGHCGRHPVHGPGQERKVLRGGGCKRTSLLGSRRSLSSPSSRFFSVAGSVGRAGMGQVSSQPASPDPRGPVVMLALIMLASERSYRAILRKSAPSTADDRGGVA